MSIKQESVFCAVFNRMNLSILVTLKNVSFSEIYPHLRMAAVTLALSSV